MRIQTPPIAFAGTESVRVSVPATSRQDARGEDARIAWIDAARGIGILFVVLGHLETGFTKRSIYAFHMPLFFFLSGIVHKISTEYGDYFRKRSTRLLVPYVAFLCLLAPLELHRAAHGGREAIHKTLVDMLWGGNRLTGDYGVFWFITCLFVTQQIANWLLSKFPASQVVACGTVSLGIAYINSIFFPHFTLPLDLGVVAAALPFYLAGYYAKKAELDRWWITLGAASVVVATLWLVYRSVPIQYDMRSAVYGVPALSLLSAGCCIIAVIQVSKAVLLAPNLATILEGIGAASMGIMFVHEPLSGLLAFHGLAAFPPLAAFLLISLVSYTCTVALSRFRLGRLLFLGSEKELLFLNQRRREPGSLKAGQARD